MQLYTKEEINTIKRNADANNVWTKSKMVKIYDEDTNSIMTMYYVLKAIPMRKITTYGKEVMDWEYVLMEDAEQYLSD